MNLFSLLEQSAIRFPRHGAVFAGTEQVLDYDTLRARALSLAAALRRRCGDGDRVAIVSENRAEYIELLFATWAAGLVAVPINAKLHPREIVPILDDAQAAALFVSPALAPAIAETPSPRTVCETVVIAGDAYAGCVSGAPMEARAVEPETLAWLFYTSGTTGRSKGAMLSHRNLLAMSIAYLADIDVVDEHASLVHAAPMSHGSGLYILPYVARAARHVIPASSGCDPRADHGAAAAHRGRALERSPSEPAHARLWRRADVRRRAQEGYGGVRPGVRADLRAGRSADDDHRIAPRGPRARGRLGPRLGRLAAQRRRCGRRR